MTDAKERLNHVTRPMQIRGKTLRNRVYLPGHQPGLADNGMPGERYINYHRERAKAGLGMQITGATPVLWSEVWADGITLVNVDDRIIPGYQKLSHVGAMETTGEHIISASWEHSELTQRMSREATAEQLEDIIALYRAAASRCREGNLDGVEVTMAHGMLLASFLSPYMNHRTDEYGGDLEGRTLFPRRILQVVREAMGEDTIIGVRMPGDELVEGGIRAEDAAEIARRLVATGIVDYISVTAGNNTRKMPRVDHWPPTPAPFGAFRHLSRAVKQAVDVPVATVGRVTTVELAEEIMASGDADLVGMVRANVADPRLLPKARAGEQRTIRPCIGANVCINSLMDHKPLICMVNPEVGKPAHMIDQPIGGSRSAIVVGGGPAGMEAARRLALRGFSTRLIEQSEALGGQMGLWSSTPSREEFKKIIKWWRNELTRLDVTVQLGEEATAEDLIRRHPSVVLVATGSKALSRKFDSDAMAQYGAYDAPTSGGHIVVYDEMGKLPALLTAERLSLSWKKVTLVTSALNPGEGEGLTTAYSMIRALGRRGVQMIDRTKIAGVEGKRIHLTGVFDEARSPIENVDAVVSLTGAISVDGLYKPLQDAGLTVLRIGDAKLPRDVTQSVSDAATTVWSLTLANITGVP
jgi:2,4-dienoyl-CoA reductase-like NADH-dependent reductase (Old Yellow Enzyme family)